MLLVLFTVIIDASILYFYLKPFIDTIFYSVPNEPKYIHSYVPLVGHAIKRWVYFYDEQAYRTHPLPSMEWVFIVNVLPMKKFKNSFKKKLHQYLVRDELEILNKRVFDSLIRSMKYDAKLIHTNPNKTVDFFDLFGEFMLYASCDSLF